MKKNTKAFTLVELIVVITILAILGTISFISLQGYSKTARDSRRISDISNIKTSLELFILNTGYYPTPDNAGEVDYEGELLWTQGTVGDNVTRNLSRNLVQKPTDPLYDFEYVYSITNSKKEYEVMSVYERGISNKNLLSNTYASSTYDVKVEGTYNGIFIKTSGYIVPTPSIITSEEIGLGLSLNNTNIDSMVVTNGKNIPALSIPNTKTSTGGLDIHLSVYTGSITADSEDPEKIIAMTKIQGAYTGTELENDTIYKTILGNTTDEELISIIDDVVLNKTPAPTIESDNDAPVGGNFSIPSTTSTANITLTITCPAETGVEMYVSGDITNTLAWEACSSSKNVELTSGDGNKNISVVLRDSNGNETNIINENITYSSATYSWYTSSYGACDATSYWGSRGGCSVTCGGGTQYRYCQTPTGTSSRTVYCERNDGIQVNDSYCSGTKPTTTSSCTANYDGCSGTNSQSTSCNTQACPIDCYATTLNVYGINMSAPNSALGNVWLSSSIQSISNGTIKFSGLVACQSGGNWYIHSAGFMGTTVTCNSGYSVDGPKCIPTPGSNTYLRSAGHNTIGGPGGYAITSSTSQDVLNYFCSSKGKVYGGKTTATYSQLERERSGGYDCRCTSMISATSCGYSCPSTRGMTQTFVTSIICN